MKLRAVTIFVFVTTAVFISTLISPGEEKWTKKSQQIHQLNQQPLCKLVPVCMLAKVIKKPDVPKSILTTYVPLPPTTTTTTIKSTSYSVANYGGGWNQIAKCEEGGSNNYTYGYFGIIPSSWAGYAGVSTAGQADWNTQVTRAMQISGGVIPWCPPNCAAGGYKGW